jgi:hypothetical protein
VLSDLPERTLLDPAADRGSEPADPAVAAEHASASGTRRIA